MLKVSVIIPTRGKSDLVKACLTSLFKCHEPTELEVVVFEQGGEASKAVIEERFQDKPVKWYQSGEDWNYSKINNEAAKVTTAPYILLLNNDTVPKPYFLANMLSAFEQGEDKTVAVVGAKLLFPNNTLQHCGVVFSSEGVPYHLGWGKTNDGSFAPADRSDYFDSVTFACALIRRDVWDELGGLDEEFHFNYEDVDFCLRAREKGYRVFYRHDADVIHLESQSAEARHTDKHSVLQNLAILNSRWIATGKLQKLTGLLIDRKTFKDRHEHLNIVFVPSSRGAGVPWWRMELPVRKIHKLGLANVRTVYADMDQAKVIEILADANVALFQGFTHEWVVRMAKMRRPFKMAYDYDDHPLYISPYASAYRYFGVKEIQERDPKGNYYLWRDGESGFDIERNMNNRHNQLEILAAVDMVTTSTKPLWDYFSTLNRNTVLLPNAIDFDIYRHHYTQWKRRKGPVRIGWHGGDNHYHDIVTVGSWLREFVNSHDVELVLFGAYYKGPFKGIDPNKVVEEEWVHVEAFPYKLASLGIDVAVVPLMPPTTPELQFNRYKSNIKYLEYSALKIPSLVAEGTYAYSCCADDDNCLTYSGKEEFLEKLERLVKDVDLREHLANRALEYVHEHFDLEKNIHRWLAAFETLVNEPAEVAEAS